MEQASQVLLELTKAAITFIPVGWNWLDFCVVCLSYLDFTSLGNLTAIRSIRALRPLRTITKIPQLKVLRGQGSILPGILVFGPGHGQDRSGCTQQTWEAPRTSWQSPPVAVAASWLMQHPWQS
jgi:hypothetical protein